MHVSPKAAAWAVVCALASAAANAVPPTHVLTLAAAIDLARERGPVVLAARAQVDEARGRLRGASVLLQDNPTATTSAGPRFKPSPPSASPELDLGISQSFELGGQRTARVARAEADVAEAQASVDNAERTLARDVAAAFLGGLYASERLTLTQAAAAGLESAAANITRRQQAGDVPLLDVHLAQSAAARARAEVRSALALRAAALGDLRVLLGLDAAAPLILEGSLASTEVLSATRLDAALVERADLRALRACLRQAEADAQLGEAMAWPDLGAGVGYALDDGDHLATGTLSISIPVFNAGQGVRAEATARVRTLQLQLGAAERAARAALFTDLEVLAERTAAADELAQHALPLLDDNVRIATRAWQAGELGLLDLLTIQREANATRTQHLDLLLGAALARIDVLFAAGAQP